MLSIEEDLTFEDVDAIDAPASGADSHLTFESHAGARPGRYVTVELVCARNILEIGVFLEECAKIAREVPDDIERLGETGRFHPDVEARPLMARGLDLSIRRAQCRMGDVQGAVLILIL